MALTQKQIEVFQNLCAGWALKMWVNFKTMNRSYTINPPENSGMIYRKVTKATLDSLEAAGAITKNNGVYRINKEFKSA